MSGQVWQRQQGIDTGTQVEYRPECGLLLEKFTMRFPYQGVVSLGLSQIFIRRHVSFGSGGSCGHGIDFIALTGTMPEDLGFR
jgi:hypothetical protein